MFNALLLNQGENGTIAEVRPVEESQLDDGNVTIRVEYSTINYKDALAITGKAPVVRRFPMIPGIDLAGTVTRSEHVEFVAGAQVILNGWGVGETRTGGLAQMARVPGENLLALPSGMTPRQSMAIGTAGYTAMLAVIRLEFLGVTPERGDVLVTGASGGVGGFAIALLARAGFRVVASTGRLQEEAYLRELGAAEVIDRATLASPGKPLAKERWIGAIDSLGGHTLANVCAATRYGGVVCTCGLAQSMEFPGSVAPFILRGVTLAGIDSVYAPRASRVAAWQRLARDLDAGSINSIVSEIGLSEAVGAAGELLAGRVKGRLVVDVNR